MEEVVTLWKPSDLLWECKHRVIVVEGIGTLFYNADNGSPFFDLLHRRGICTSCLKVLTWKEDGGVVNLYESPSSKDIPP